MWRIVTVLILCVVFNCVSARGQTVNAANTERVAAAKTLESTSASIFDKAKACQRLATIGDATSVPALAPLLQHNELSNYARHAIENISDPTATLALQDAAAQMSGTLLAGVLNSLGRKSDAKSVPVLAQYLSHSDRSITQAAGNGLAEIGNAEAADQLWAALSGTPNSPDAFIAQAYLKCGQRLQADGQFISAREVFERLTADSFDPSIQLAALYNKLLQADESDADQGDFTELQEVLQSEMKPRFQVGLQVWRARVKTFDPAQIEHAIALLGETHPSRAALLIDALADLPEEHLPQAVRLWAQTAAPEMMAAALRVLTHSGVETDIELAMLAASNDSPIVAEAARQAIIDVPDDSYDSAILKGLDSTDVPSQKTAIDLAAGRRLTSASEQMIRIAKNTSHGLQLDAIRALGSTVAPEQLPALVSLASQNQATPIASAAREGLRIACVRLPQSASAAALRNAWGSTDGEAKIYLLEQLAQVGGPVALDTLEQAVRSPDDSMQDAGTRLLGEAMSPDVAPLLLKLAASLPDPKYQVRTLRGALRIARQLDLPLSERMTICRQAVRISRRDEERLLALDIYRQYPSVEALTEAVAMLSLESPADKLGDATCKTILTIAGRTSQTDPLATGKALRAVIAARSNSAIKAEASSMLENLSPKR